MLDDPVNGNKSRDQECALVDRRLERLVVEVEAVLARLDAGSDRVLDALTADRVAGDPPAGVMRLAGESLTLAYQLAGMARVAGGSRLRPVLRVGKEYD